MDQHAGGVDARLVREDVEADAWLGGLHGDSRHALEVASQLSQLLVLEMRNLDSEQISQLQQDLVHRGVARPLADAVDAGRKHLGARAQSHDSVPSAKPEVVVKMHYEGRVGRRGLDARNVLTDGKRRVAADGVGRRRSGATGPQTLAVQLRD